MINLIKSLIKRCQLSSAQDDSKNFLTSQITYMGMVGKTEIYYPYGLKSSAPIGEPGISFSILSQEDNKITMPYSFNALSKLPSVQPGEVIIGSPKTGAYIKFSENGEITVSGKITFLSEVTANIKVTTKEVDATVKITTPEATINGINHSTHKHTGVTSGPDTSGEPVA